MTYVIAENTVASPFIPALSGIINAIDDQTNTPFWEWLLGMMPWWSKKTPADMLHTYYERPRSLVAEVRTGRDLFSKTETESIRNTLLILREGACTLRNFVEKFRYHVSNVTDDAASENLERLLRQLAKDSEQMERTEGMSLGTQLSVTLRDAVDVKILEGKMAKLMRKIAGIVIKLHRFAFDGCGE
ncbi:hypothetical protein NCS56_01515400 [Fusarium sp. Ph1]|nr:hypothetical protein NCS56_01515400 [Fusarium sp. Ph1]